MSFNRFPTDPEQIGRWIATVRRKNLTPSELTWICSAHFHNGKSNDPTSPDYVPSIFSQLPQTQRVTTVGCGSQTEMSVSPIMSLERG